MFLYYLASLIYSSSLPSSRWAYTPFFPRLLEYLEIVQHGYQHQSWKESQEIVRKYQREL